MEPTRAKVISFLRRDLFRNVVLLKALDLHPDDIHLHYCETQSGTGALVLLPTQVSLFDAREYPQTRFVVMLDCTNPEMADELVPFIPRDASLIFKLHDATVRARIERTFPLRRVTAYVAYTDNSHAHFTPDSEVVISESVSEQAFELFKAQGHPRREVQAHFAQGEALCFTLNESGVPVATCFTFRNFENVHEIGGVYTLPQERRRGLARRVVLTALHTLEVRGRIPRYVVQESNTTSAHLAQSLGLEAIVTMEHRLYDTP